MVAAQSIPWWLLGLGALFVAALLVLLLLGATVIVLRKAFKR